MKKRLYILLVLVIAFMMAMPTAVFATTPPPANATRGTMTVEYRYMDGQQPSIPAEIVQFGFRFYLVSQSAPVLESTLPAERTYTYSINGLLTPDRLKELEKAFGILATVTVTKKPITLQLEIDKEASFSNLATNDVDTLRRSLPVFTATDVLKYINDKDLIRGLTDENEVFDVNALVDPEITGVEFATLPLDSDGLPTGYDANVVYRALVEFKVWGYTDIDVTYKSEDAEEIDVYIIFAEYESDELPLPIEVVDITDETVPLEPGGLTEEEQQQVENQTGNLGTDIVDGNVPLGNPGVTSTWSLISLILSIAALVILAVHAIGLVAKRKREEDEEALGIDNEKLELIQKRAALYRILTIIVGAVTIVTWLYLDNLTLGVTWINAYTPIVGILFAITVVLLVFTKLQSDKARHEKEKEHEDVADIA